MIQKLRQRDIKYLWHPYTQIASFEKMAFPVIERARGTYLYEVGGRPLLDGIASWWCVNLGHSHPKLIEAICEQAGLLQHSILGGMSHPKVIELAEQLAAITPGALNRSFFSGDGASSIEAALKIAVQYWANTGERNRTRFIALTDGYHGDTLGAVGVGYVDTFHRCFKNVVHQAFRAQSPHCAQCPYDKTPDICDIECFGSMEALIHHHHNETAAVVVEPLCQGAAGIRIYPEEYLRKLRNLCSQYGLLLIADEIAVGFGRTGYMFACERAGIIPDIMTLGKGLTGGTLPMSAVMVTESIYDSFRSEKDSDKTFYHGHTFCGNPITSAAATAALSAYKEENVLENSRPKIAQLKAGMEELGMMLNKSFTLTLGMIGVMEINDESGAAERAGRIARRAYELGLFIRPLGRSVYLWPPLTATEDELSRMLSILKTSIEQTDNLH
jgi:adenosylmethionine-8-amino-7-oxononanoate aminotransferase